jgi:uncharacterized membrane protein YvbJ
MWCHNCWHKEEDGALLCSKCNTKMPPKTPNTPSASQSGLNKSIEVPEGLKAVGGCLYLLIQGWWVVCVIIAVIGFFSRYFYFK